MWKIRPNFSHLYSKIMSRVNYSTDYVKREKFNDILHGCGKIDLIRTSCDLLDRKRHMWKIRPNFSHLYSPKVCRLFDIWPNIAHVCNSIEFFTAVKNFHRIRHSHDIFDRIHHMWKTQPNFSHLYLPKISNVKFRLNMSNIRNIIEYFTDVNNLTKFVKVITYSAEYITCEKFDRISLTYILPKCVTCKKFDRICHLWGIRSNTLQLWNYGKIDLTCHTVVTHLTENITYEKYVPVSHTYNSQSCHM